MTLCRTIAEVVAAADLEAASLPPLTQEQADLVAAILAPYYARLAREQAHTPT